MANSPSVTIVSVPREQFSRTRISLRSILDASDHEWPIIFVDGTSRAELRRELTTMSERVSIIHRNEYLSGNEARNLALAQVRSIYAIFIDNDVQLWPGALSAMVKYAEETDAGIVAPLCCIGLDARGEHRQARGKVRGKIAIERRSRIASRHSTVEWVSAA